jgi:hypothetical protein
MSATSYEVRQGEQLALRVTDRPGALVSRMAPPPAPDEPVTVHPFLTATAYLPEVEGELRELLDESASTQEYLDRLRRAGYTVEAIP